MNSKNLTYALRILLLFSLSFDFLNLCAQAKLGYQLENPMSVAFLKKNLNKQTPRLILNKKINRNLRQKLKSDPTVKAFYETLEKDAAFILEQPLLERVVVGRRMSNGKIRERLSTLGMVYHLSKDVQILNRINLEVLAVCAFPDWNPSHFLDVSGTAISVALAIDWAGSDLPKETVEIAKQALIDKGILPSFNKDYNGWVKSHHNWNQVCQAGMIGAAIVIAEKDPELASKTISRALDNMGLALKTYGPDGVYPEGATYWGYGTMHTVMTASMFESAFGTDFGISDIPGFMESANFVPLVTAPSGEFYNFYDCGSNLLENNRGYGDASVAMFNRSSIAVNLMWFAAKTGKSFYFDKSYFTDSGKDRRKQYFDAAALVWLSQFEATNKVQLPSSWKGESVNPLIVFQGEHNNSEMYYLGAKGGKASNNHGNMDAGSFIFELYGIRWSIDLGNQNYNTLEQAGFDLWNSKQNSERWSLLTKSNFGHSTISVNNQRHIAEGMATIVDFKEGDAPEATFDMTPTFKGQLKLAKRKFLKDSPTSIIVEDYIELSEETEQITWQMMTVADVEVVDGGAILSQKGKKLKLENLSHPELTVSVVSLYPAPLALDSQIEGLKRIEIRIPAWTIEGDNTKIKVRLSGI
jgi:hypothetical protein